MYTRVLDWICFKKMLLKLSLRKPCTRRNGLSHSEIGYRSLGRVGLKQGRGKSQGLVCNRARVS